MADIQGRTIETVRGMTEEEMQIEGWAHRGPAPPVLVLDNGSKIYPSQDPEGNGPGSLFGVTDGGFGFFLSGESNGHNTPD